MKRHGWLIAAWLGVVTAAGAITEEEAVKRVQQRIQGRILGAKAVTEDGRKVYVVRILTPDGRVRHLRVDAASGEILPNPPRP